MVFKMKGSPIKLGNIATKSTLKMKSPLETTKDMTLREQNVHEGEIAHDPETGKHAGGVPMKSPMKDYKKDLPITHPDTWTEAQKADQKHNIDHDAERTRNIEMESKKQKSDLFGYEYEEE